jgi:hypothetical protein
LSYMSQNKSKKKLNINPEETLRRDVLIQLSSLQEQKGKENALELQFKVQLEVLKGYWEIEKKAREDRRHVLLDKEHRLQGIKDKHIVNLGNYKQTIKELLLANQDDLAMKTTQLLMGYQSLMEQQNNEISQLQREMRDVSNGVNETTISHDKSSLVSRRLCDDEATLLRDEANRKIYKLASDSEEKIQRMRIESEQKLRDEMKELEKRNDAVIQEVMEKNRYEIHQLRTIRGTTMNNNLDRIVILRREMALLKEQDRLDRWVLTELQTQNENIARPLEMNTNLLHQLESDVEICAKQKQDLNALLPRLRKANEELKAIEWDHEVLLQNLTKLENDRDEWKKKAQQSILSAQRESNFQNLLLECKLTELSMTGEGNTAAVANVLQRANVDLKSLDRSQVCITDVVHDKNEQIELLRQRLKHIKLSHQTLICRHQTLVEEAKQQLNAS